MGSEVVPIKQIEFGKYFVNPKVRQFFVTFSLGITDLENYCHQWSH